MGLKVNSLPKSRSSYFLLVILLFLAAGIIFLGYAYYAGYKKQYLTEVVTRLSSIADLKVGGLSAWREERLGEAGIFYKNAAFSSAVKRYLENPDGQEGRDYLRIWLENLQKAHLQYESVFLVDAGGAERISAPQSPRRASSALASSISEALQSGKITVQDFYRNENDGKIYLAVLVPVLDDKKPANPLGVLVFRIDPEAYLYPFIRRWPTPSRTAETLLVRLEGDDILSLNELKFRQDAALKLRFPASQSNLPVAKEIAGYSGVAEGIDYRGERVIACTRPVPDSPWFVVARLDVSEAYAPLTIRFWVVAVLVAALLAGASSGVALIWRVQRVRFYRKQYESAVALRETNEYLQNLITYANAPIAVWDAQLKLTQFNQAFEAMTGRKSFEVIGMPAKILFPAGSADDYMKQIKESLESKQWKAIELGIQHIDGSMRTVLLSPTTIFYGNSTSARAVIVQCQDITERKKAEDDIRIAYERLKATQDELIQSEKMAAIGRFSSGVVHEVNNPLGIILSAAELLEKKISGHDQSAMPTLARIKESALRASSVLHSILQYARPSELKFETVDAQDIIKTVIPLFEHRAHNANIVIEPKYSDEMIRVNVDKNQIHQVLFNIIKNAIEAMPNGGQLKIALYKAIVPELSGDRAACVIDVTDTGTGISKDALKKLAEPFFTTKDPGAGTGLGLFVVKTILDNHNGRLLIDSEEGKGTKMRVALPLVVVKNNKGKI